MNAHNDMIVGRKGDYRNKASAIREGKAIQAEALKVSQTAVSDVNVVRARLTKKLAQDRALRAPK